jgi:WD40 repeat protein
MRRNNLSKIKSDSDERSYLLVSTISWKFPVIGVALLEDFLIAIADASPVISIWNIKSVSLVQQLIGRTIKTRGLIFVSDQVIASDKSIKIWHYKSGRLLKKSH